MRTDGVGFARFAEIGASSEGFWVHFTDKDPVTLRVGDRIVVSATFTLQGFVATSGQDIRFGLFDSMGTRNTTNLTGGVNSPVFVDDTGYGAAFFGSGTGAPFRLYRRATLPGNPNIFLSFADFAELPGTGATSRQTLANDTDYTLTLSVERLSESDTRITASLGEMMFSAVETSAEPARSFDWFGFRITNNTFAAGFTFSEFAAKLIPAPPVITVQPSPLRQTIAAGSTLNLFVGAVGTGLVYEWRRNGTAVENGGGASLRIANVRTSDSGTYEVVVSNATASVVSSPVAVTVADGPVGPAPIISAQPVSTRVVVGGSAALTVRASGVGLTYQWFHKGAILPGETGPSLALINARVEQSGEYVVVVSNANGSVASAGAVLTVVSAATLVTVAPAAGATNVCMDTPLTLRFDRPMRLGSSGRLRVLHENGELVASLDAASPVISRNIGGAPNSIRSYPVIVDGSLVSIYLPARLPDRGTHTITMDTGFLADATGAPFTGIADWKFTTRAVPALGARINVDAAGRGDFCTVQGAIDALPVPNTEPVTISVAAGVYNEIVYVRSTRPFVTIVGEDRFRTVIQYANNNTLNPATATRPSFNVDASDFRIENLTLRNTTPRGGSQAEAFRSNGLRTILHRVNLQSFQDTLLINTGTAFINESLIEGDVDFIWGGGSAYFLRSEIRSVSSGAFITQVRNAQGRAGFVFVGCHLTAAEGVTNTYLARINPDQFPESQVVFLWTLMGPHINRAGWLFNDPTRPLTPANYPLIRFWEFRSLTLDGTEFDTSGRAPASRVIDEETAGSLLDPAVVLQGWRP